MYKIISGFKSYKSKKNIIIKNNVEVLKDINIEIHRGKVTGLIGLNGAGKSTIIKVFTGLTTLTKGKLLVDGEEIKNKKNFMKKVNLVNGGERNLYWRLSGYQNLEYFGNLYGVKLLDTKINSLLKLVGLADYSTIPVEQYSKGMKQRLQIAKGLINDPNYLFLDEPTLGIDQRMTQELQSLIKNIARDRHIGVMITSHSITDIESTSDYIYLLDDGKIIDEGSINEILLKNNIQHLYKIVFEKDILLDMVYVFESINESTTVRFIDTNVVEIASIIDVEYRIHSLFNEYNLAIHSFSHVSPKLETLIEKRLK